MATVLAKVGLQRLQPILDAQEVDLPALLELDEEVCLLTIAIMTLVWINRLKPLLLKDLKELGVRNSTEREALLLQLAKIKQK